MQKCTVGSFGAYSTKKGLGEKMFNRDWNEKLEVITTETLRERAEKEFDEMNTLTQSEIMISIGAGLSGSAIDILCIKGPVRTPQGIEDGSWGNFVRKQFSKCFPQEKMQKLANTSFCKVTYDAQDNRNTIIPVEGLSTNLHRLLSPGHDPVLGMVVGVKDILTGTMTTIDTIGNFASQKIPGCEKRKGKDLFESIAKQIVHLESDVTTSMGLPVPFMVLFNVLQFGNIGELDKTIAEIVQEMYKGGYDFIHFCSLAFPVMVTEVIIRLAYAVERIKEGASTVEAVPILMPGEHSKLATMLLIGHSVAAAVNAGKVYFTKNPMSINYNQWIRFAQCACKETKWVLFGKKKAKEDYIENYMIRELDNSYKGIWNGVQRLSPIRI